MTEENPEVPTLTEPRNPVIFIDTLELLELAVQDLSRASGPIALDAERASGFKYSQRAYLVQLYRAGSAIYLLDPIPFANMEVEKPFERLTDLVNAEEWVLHAASQDLPCLRELGFVPSKIFDTELGSRLAGLPRVGLGAVVEEFLGFRLAKEHSAVDWSTRPLAESWLRYAALDVDVLLELRDALISHVHAQDKVTIVNEEFDFLLSFMPKAPKIDRWRGASGLHEVKDARSLAVARELWSAREDLARKLDVSPGRLVPDSSITAVAKSTPKTKPELSSMKSFAGRASRTYLDTWWRAIELGSKTLDLPPLRLPATGIPNRRTWKDRFPEADGRFKAAKTRIASLSDLMKIPAENLLKPSILEEICFQPPKPLTVETIYDRLMELGARPWQTKLLSPELFLAFTVDLELVETVDPDADTPEVEQG